MKQNLLFLFYVAALPFFLSSCSKSGRIKGEGYYITITKNGEDITFKGIGKMGPDFVNPSLYNLSLSGWQNGTPQTFDINIQTENLDTVFTPGLYTSDDPDFYTYLCYATSNENGSDPVNYDNQHSSAWGDSSYYEITITSITDTEITGSFVGNYLINSVDPADKMDITKGVFRVKRLR